MRKCKALCLSQHIMIMMDNDDENDDNNDGDKYILNVINI